LIEDFGLLELATNAGGEVEKITGILHIAHTICNPEDLSINRTTLMARVTPHQLKLVPIKQKRKYKIYQERRGVIKEWQTVALCQGKDAVIYNPSLDPCFSLRRIHPVEH